MSYRLAPGVNDERRLVLEKLGFDPDRAGKRGWMPPSKTSIGTLKVLEAVGVSHDECRRLARMHPALLDHSGAQVSGAWLNLMDQGFCFADIHRIIARTPHVLTASLIRTGEVIRVLEDHGFDRSAAVVILARAPGLFFASPEWNDRQLRMLKRYFGKARTLRICQAMPYILEQGTKKIRLRLRTLEAEGFARKDVAAMAAAYLCILCQSPRRLAELCRFFRAVGADARAKPNLFAFSPKLLRGRWVVMQKYPSLKARKSLLLSNNANFARLSGMTRDEVVACDPGPEAFHGRISAPA